MKKFLSAFVFVILFYACKPSYQIKLESSHSELVNTNADSAAQSLIYPYKNQMKDVMDEVIAFSEVAMTKNQPEGVLGNFVADCLFEMGKNALGKDSGRIDAVLLNNGGLRASLPQGEIKMSNVYELMPFDNELKIVELSGDQCEKMLAFIAGKGGVPVSNLRMKIVKGKAVDVFINGKAFDKNKSYTILSSDYLINGGDKMDFFINPIKAQELNLLIRDAIISYLRKMKKENKKIQPKVDGRISLSE